jgi:hypothetical protein
VSDEAKVDPVFGDRLEPWENVVWRGKRSYRKLAWMALFPLLIFVIYPLLSDGSEENRVLLLASPFVVALIIGSLLYWSFVQAHYAVTDRRVMAMFFAPWHKPKFKSGELGKVEAIKLPKTPVVIGDRATKSEVFSMTLSGKDIGIVMSLVNQGVK